VKVKSITLIGDVHQNYHLYLPLTKKFSHTIQLGDLGFDYSYLRGKVDPSKHKFIFGNHDCYDAKSDEYCLKQPSCIGKFGMFQFDDFKEFPPIFYCSGAWSIDQERRKRHGLVTWWPEEELSLRELNEAISLYKKTKPEIVISHECPLEIVPYVTDPDFCLNFGFPSGIIKTRTNMALQAMLDFHRPKLIIFGHYHKYWADKIDGTTFICLDMCRSKNQTNNYFDLTESVLTRERSEREQGVSIS
jgi:predicted phosphodiesterase